MREGTTHSAEDRVAEKSPRTDRSDTQMGGGEAGTSQSQSRHKKGHMSNIYLIDSVGKAILDFVKDHKELYDKTKNI